MKKRKDVRKLHSVELFEHTIGDRKVNVVFKLDGEIGDGLVETGTSIKCPDDSDDSAYGTGLAKDRIVQKNDKVHYGVMDDVDILDWAAKGMAYDAIERIEKWNAEAKATELAKIQAVDAEIYAETKAKVLAETESPIKLLKSLNASIFEELDNDCENCEYQEECNMINFLDALFPIQVIYC